MEEMSKEELIKELYKILGCNNFENCGNVYEDCRQCPFYSKEDKKEVITNAIKYIKER